MPPWAPQPVTTAPRTRYEDTGPVRYTAKCAHGVCDVEYDAYTHNYLTCPCDLET